MKKSSYLQGLRALIINEDESLYRELVKFEELISDSAKEREEESVPAEMMEMFSDEQWPALLFELQPSFRLFETHYDVIKLRNNLKRQSKDSIEKGLLINSESENKKNIGIFRQQNEIVIWEINILEQKALKLLMARKPFNEVAEKLWSNDTVEISHQNLTTLLLSWLQLGLIIDVGVPIPDDAEFG